MGNWNSADSSFQLTGASVDGEYLDVAQCMPKLYEGLSNYVLVVSLAMLQNRGAAFISLNWMISKCFESLTTVVKINDVLQQ